MPIFTGPLHLNWKMNEVIHPLPGCHECSREVVPCSWAPTRSALCHLHSVHVLLQLGPQTLHPQGITALKGCKEARNQLTLQNGTNYPYSSSHHIFFERYRHANMPKAPTQNKHIDTYWILTRELVLHTDFHAPWSPSQPPSSKLHLTYIYVTCY